MQREMIWEVTFTEEEEVFEASNDEYDGEADNHEEEQRKEVYSIMENAK